MELVPCSSCGRSSTGFRPPWKNRRYVPIGAAATAAPSPDRFHLIFQVSPAKRVRCFASVSSSSASGKRPLARFNLQDEQINGEVIDADDADAVLDEEEAMMQALRNANVEAAWRNFQKVKRLGGYPGRTCMCWLMNQLCNKGTASSIARAQEVFMELFKMDKVAELLNSEALGLLVAATSKAGTAQYAYGVYKKMLKERYYPHVKAWSTLVSRLGRDAYTVHLALQVFDEICQILEDRHVVQLPKRRIMDDAQTGQSEGTSENLEALSDESDLSEGSEVFEGTSVSDETTSTAETQDSSHEENDLVTFVDENTNTFMELDEDEKEELLMMKPDTVAFNAVLNACATAGDFRRAEEIWDYMTEFRVAPNIITYNTMIKLYGIIQHFNKLQNLLRNMMSRNVKPDIHTFNSLVAVFVGFREIAHAEYIIRGLRGELQEDSNNEIGILVELKQLIRLAKDMKPDSRTYTILMKGYVHEKRVSNAVQLLAAMQHEQDPASLPHQVSYTTAILACTRMGLMKEARLIVNEMKSQGVPPNIVTYNTLLQAACRVGDMDQALLIVQEIHQEGVPMTAITFNTLINGYLEAGEDEHALAVFNAMREEEIPATKATYCTLMKAFQRREKTELVVKVFNAASNDPRVRLDDIAWNTLIAAYARAGLHAQATRAFELMKKRGVHPTNATYTPLLKLYGRYRHWEKILQLWKEIRERSLNEDRAAVKEEPIIIGALRPDEGLLDCLIDTFVRGRYFHLALEVVDCMDRQGIDHTKAKIKYKRLYVDLYANIFTSRHASEKRQARRAGRRRSVEAFKFWLGLPNSYYSPEWRMDPEIKGVNDNEI